MNENQIQQGFIFINAIGRYAVLGLSSGFGQATEVVNWTHDINAAQIFPHENQARRKFPTLAKCHAIKAIAKREVTFCDWSEENGI